jgi:serine/threonine protein kinase
MEFVEGGNFRDFLRIRGKFSPSEATRYIIDMAEGLNYALSQRLTHRDLKLTNVLLSSQGVAKLVDFGLAGSEGGLKQFEEEVDRALEYATLEKGTGAPDNDPRSDLYFLGAIYYELLAGRPPYPSTNNRQERKRFGRYRDIKPLRSIDPSISPALETVVQRLMEINPNVRYQTPGEVLRELKAMLPQLAAVDAAATSSFNGAGSAEDDPLLIADDTATSQMEGDTSGENSGRFRDQDLKPSLPTILCVESRPKHQDALRDYFTRHGYRVLILTDPQRALMRMAGDPPEVLLLIGDVLGEQLPKVVGDAVSAARRYGTAIVVAPGKKAIADLSRLECESLVTVMPQQVTLRDIRHAVGEVRQRNASMG